VAVRPIFLPTETSNSLVREVNIEFRWHPGMALSQARRNISALHSAAAQIGLSPILEVSSKSEHEVGRRLSAFSLKLRHNGKNLYLESIYQGSKVFERGGPYQDILTATPKDAKNDLRIRNSGDLTGFQLGKDNYPLLPRTAFYDWLYVQALLPHLEFVRKIHFAVGFSDIAFNPGRSLNCQARSLAMLIALDKRGLVESYTSSFDEFVKLYDKFGLSSHRGEIGTPSRHLF
jgi:hypothetical protein